jgi:hypothetical protein
MVQPTSFERVTVRCTCSTYVLDPIEPPGIQLTASIAMPRNVSLEWKAWNDGSRAHLLGTGFELTCCVCIAQ